MLNETRIVIAATRSDTISALKSAFEKRPYVDSIFAVSTPQEAESKMRIVGTMVLIWDLDEFPPNHALERALQRRYTMYTLYISVSRAKYALLPENGNTEFIQKPAVFTPTTTWKFVSAAVEFLDTATKRQAPPNMRELVKMVAAGDSQKVVLIGSSTGGTNAIESILKRLPRDCPPIAVVQHMPSGFTKLFADRLNALYPQEIREANSGDFLMRGRVLIAPADRHMRITKQQGKLAVECYLGSRIHGVMPAADILFESAATVLGSKAVGVILTGMGNDGAKGLKQMRAAGCENIGQDEASCVVYGMPKAARDIGAISREYPLDQIADTIMRLANK